MKGAARRPTPPLHTLAFGQAQRAGPDQRAGPEASRDQSRMAAIRHEARGAAREPGGGTPGRQKPAEIHCTVNKASRANMRTGPRPVSPQQVVPITNDSHHDQQRIRSRSLPCRLLHCPPPTVLHPCPIQARPATTTSLSSRQKRPYLSDVPSVGTSCTRSCLWPRRRSTKWNSAANSRAASASPPAASSGTWKKSKPGSKTASKLLDQRKPTSRPART